jgi:sugar phosphate isomerase/epimerase
MNTSFSRRRFLQSSLGTTLALAGGGVLAPLAAPAIEPIKRSGSSRLRLSLAAYSFRQTFNHQDPAKRITLFDFVDFCADHGCDGAEVTAYYFPAQFDSDYLVKLKRHAFLRGIEISGSAVGNNFALPKDPKRDEQIAMTKKWIDRCAILGAPHIRVFGGPEQKDLEKAQARNLCVEALEECCDYAGTKGIFLGLENHGGIVAESKDLLDIVRAVKSPWLGVNLDTGNFHTDDPYVDLAKCAPYAVNVQYKVEVQYRGKPKQSADMPRVIKILRDANYQGYVALEYEAAEDAWKAVPTWLEKLRQQLGSWP